jgi:hypothetical protein
MSQKTYYLSSLESKIFSKVRRCDFLNTLHFDSGKECVLAKIIPGVIGQEFGCHEDIKYVVLASRNEGECLSLMTKFPYFVFITRPLINDINTRLTITQSDLEILAWGELYRTKTEAENHVFD